MSYCEKNDLSIYNNIVYQIYEIEDIDEMRLTFLKSIRLLAPYASCNFYLASKGGEHLIADPVAVDFPLDALNEYLEKIEDEDPTRWIFLHAKSMVYREKDLFSEEALERNKCFQEFYYPHNLYHSLQMSLALNGEFLGSVSFYRQKEQKEFSDYEIYFLDLLKEHLALRLYKEQQNKKLRPAEMDLSASAEKYRLTARESEVVKALIRGASIEEIGNTLCISPNTVKKHIVNIYKKMGISSRRELYKILP